MKHNALFDSNILIYSFVPSSFYFHKSRELIKSVIENDLTLYLSVQNLNEVLRALTSQNVLEKPYKLADAVKSIKVFKDLAYVIYPTPEVFDLHTELALKYKVSSSKIYDNFLVATMLSYGIFRLYTNNEKDFEFYKEIEVTNPFK